MTKGVSSFQLNSRFILGFLTNLDESFPQWVKVFTEQIKTDKTFNNKLRTT